VTTSEARRRHWQRVWTTRQPDAVSWFEPDAARSLDLIFGVARAPGAAIIDVGGGASVLVDGLLAAGFRNLTVLDVSAAALAVSRARLGPAASHVRWLEADLMTVDLAPRKFDVWHDRAVFHFLTDLRDRDRYVDLLRKSLRAGGHVVMATFASDGPEQCSGLQVTRYDAPQLADALGPSFELVRYRRAVHSTPAGASQSFLHALLRRRDQGG
jgi:SAM-dependent methyltransferase